MDLGETLANELGTERARAEVALGAVFLAVRLAMDGPAFDAVRAAFPGVTAWMATLPMGGRSGEIVALTGAGAARDRLRTLGFDDDAIARIRTVIVDAASTRLEGDLRERVGSTLTRVLPA